MTISQQQFTPPQGDLGPSGRALVEGSRIGRQALRSTDTPPVAPSTVDVVDYRGPAAWLCPVKTDTPTRR
jgi:hypothetical protein